MKQSLINNGKSITIDLSRPGIPVSASVLQPDLLNEGGMYQCIWHSEQTDAVTGEGDTPEQAIQEWDKKIQAILETPGRNDQLATELRNALMQTSDQPGPERQSKDAFDVKEGMPTQSEITPENSVVKKSREHTTDQSNKDGSE